MSKHFKKYALLLIAGLVICSMSCEKDSKSGGDNPDPKPDTGFVIEAKNVIGGNDNIATVKASVWNEQSKEWDTIATGKYENDGFKLTLPFTLNSEYLYTIGDEGFPEGVNVSNLNAKITLESISFFACNEDGGEIGIVYCKGETSNNSVDANYVYADRNFTITGTYTAVYGSTTEIVTLDYSLKKGWNTIYSRREESGGNCYYFTLTTKKPSDVTLEWKCRDWSPPSATTLQNKLFGEILNNE